MKKEYITLTKEEIFTELDRILLVNKRNARKQRDYYEYLNCLFNAESDVDYLPLIKEWANVNDINTVIIDAENKNDYSKEEIEELSKEINSILIVKNIYRVNKSFLNNRLLQTIENHSISNNKISFNNLLFVVGLDNDGDKSPDLKLTTFFIHYGINYD